jgi:hypothetical protein
MNLREPKCASQLQLLRQVLKREAFVNLYLTPANSPGLTFDVLKD